jgi:hypothetical protein
MTWAFENIEQFDPSKLQILVSQYNDKVAQDVTVIDGLTFDGEKADWDEIEDSTGSGSDFEIIPVASLLESKL